MRVLILSELFPNETQPAHGSFILRQVTELARQGVEVTVIVPMVWCPWFLRFLPRWRGQDHRRKVLAPPGVEGHRIAFLRLPGMRFNRWVGLSIYLSTVRLARRLHRARPFDLVVAQRFYPEGGAGMHLARALSVPFVCSARGTDLNVVAAASSSLQRYFVTVAREARGIVTSGHALAKKIADAAGKQALVCYGVVDLRRFAPSDATERRALRRASGLPEEGRIIVFAGGLLRTKGVHELLDAFLALCRRFDDIRLVYCGGGPERAALAARAAEVGDRVRFAGAIAPDDMASWLRASDLFALPSYSEGMPNALMEAMACGLPSVVTAVGGIPTALAGSEGAILVAPKDARAVEAALALLLESPTEALRRGAAARAKAETSFGVERTCTELRRYFEEIAVRG